MANQGTVGILRAILTADTTNFKAGMKEAASSQTAVQKSVKGLTDDIKKLTPQAERMVKAFSGDKLLYQANNLTTAVQKLGGAQKLTEAEQAKVNKTLNEAIQKYQQLGKDAPQAMRDIEQATRKVEAPSSLAAKAGDELKTSFLSLTSAFALSNVITSGVMAIKSMAVEAIASGARLVDLRDKTGLTLATLQRMEFVAGQSGDSLDSLTDAAFKLGQRLASGSGSVRQAVADLNLDFAKLQQMTPDEQWEAVAAALSQVRDQGERARLGVELFGKSFVGIAASVKAGYKQVADQAVLATDAQLEALDHAGDAWDAFYKRQTTRIRAWLGEWVMASQEFLKTGMFLPAAQPAGGGKQFGPPVPAQFKQIAAPLPPNYIAQLAGAQKALAGLTAAQRAQIEAAQKMGASQEDQLALLDQFGVKGDLAEGVLKVFTASTKEAARTLRDEFNESLKKLNEDLGRSSVLNDADFLKEFGPKLDDMSREMQKFGIVGAAVPANIAAGFRRLMTLELAQFEASMRNVSAVVLNIGREIAEQGDRLNTLVGESAGRTVDNERQAARLSTDIQFRRAQAAIDAAKQYGASWQQVYAMEAQLSRQRLQVALEESRQQFNDRVDQLRRTGIVSDEEYQSMLVVQQRTEQKMVEDWRLSEQAKRTELQRTHDTWLQLWISMKAAAKDAVRAVTDGFAEMLVGLRGFADGWKQIWQDIRRAFANVLSQMLQDFIAGFLRRIVAAASGTKVNIGIGGGGGGVGGTAAGVAEDIGGGLLGKVLGLGTGAAATTAATAATAAGTTAATGAGAASTATAAGAGGGSALGFLSNPAFWTNPYTIAAIGGTILGLTFGKQIGHGIHKLFGGGEEGVDVNPKRDQFQLQFGATKEQGFANLQSRLTAALIKNKQPDAGAKANSLLMALNGAHTLDQFHAAEDGIIGAFSAAGIKGIKKYDFGGFVPPGVIQPAILHGGGAGELAAPIGTLATMIAETQAKQGAGRPMVVNLTHNISTIDATGVREFVRSRDFLDSIAHVFTVNQHYIASRVGRTL